MHNPFGIEALLSRCDASTNDKYLRHCIYLAQCLMGAKLHFLKSELPEQMGQLVTRAFVSVL